MICVYEEEKTGGYQGTEETEETEFPPFFNFSPSVKKFGLATDAGSLKVILPRLHPCGAGLRLRKNSQRVT